MNNFYIDHTKLLPIMMGVAGFYWATNRPLPDIVVVGAFLATGVSLAQNLSKLVITEQEMLALQSQQNDIFS